ncbi:MAG: amidohydrolase family protein [Devosiaceae bacterium]|nr:amidohydrolase family protein [Devosiaceae bacterium]
MCDLDRHALLDYPVIDGHFHWWNRSYNRYAWLAPDSARPVLGDHRSLMRNFEYGDYVREVGSFLNLVGGVHIEAGCDHPKKETDWVLSQSSKHNFEVVHIARVDLTGDSAALEIEELSKIWRVRGFRMRLNADTRISSRSGISGVFNVRKNIAAIDKQKKLFELSIFSTQADEGVSLAREFPGMTFVLNHIGWPRIADGTDNFEDWRRSLQKLAACPNVFVKLSMLWPVDKLWRVEKIRPFVLETILMFGTDRVIFGSNYPIESVFGSFKAQLTNLLEAMHTLPDIDMQKIFRENAARVYDLKGALKNDPLFMGSGRMP